LHLFSLSSPLCTCRERARPRFPLRRALQDILYSGNSASAAGGGASALSITRLANLLAYAMGNTGVDGDGGGAVFVDFDSTPTTGAKLNEVMAFLLGDNARCAPLLLQRLHAGAVGRRW
jgi:hypothetical protein